MQIIIEHVNSYHVFNSMRQYLEQWHYVLHILAKLFHSRGIIGPDLVAQDIF
jgi:hypothetical protein